MRYRYPVIANQQKDELGLIYESLASVIGYADQSGIIQYYGTYDTINASGEYLYDEAYYRRFIAGKEGNDAIYLGIAGMNSTISLIRGCDGT